jgi:excisionase family DNA binding protein
MKRAKRQPKLVGVTEACATLGVSRPTLYRLMASGEIPSLKLGGRHKIPRRALDKGSATCFLCKWRVPCRSLDAGEQSLLDHLRLVHDRGLMVSRESATLRVGEPPQTPR